MKRYYEQETTDSCKASALRNVLKQFGIERTEKYLRRVCRIKDYKRASKNLINVIRQYGFEVKEHQFCSEKKFKEIIVSGLKAGSKFILMADSLQHWICAIQYRSRRVKIIDSDFLDIGKIAPDLTLRQLTKMCFNYSKTEDKDYFYFIEISEKQTTI